MTKETLEKILEKNKRIYNKRNHIDGIRCVTIEEEDSEMIFRQNLPQDSTEQARPRTTKP